MTAEIAVMNKEAIALAADSAVTFQAGREQKIFTSASKIFTLSKYHPVGVMIYGSANFMDVPWETIIKVYRNNLQQKTFKTVDEYAEDLLSFLTKNKQLFSEDVQNEYVEGSIRSYFQLIVKEIAKEAEIILKEKEEIPHTSVKKIASQIIKDDFEKWKKAKLNSGVPEGFTSKLRQKYRNLISKTKKEIFKDVFEDYPLTQHSSRQLTEIVINQFLKSRTDIVYSNTSGIVVAGFGTEDIFPVLESYSVEGRIDDYLKYKKNEAKCSRISLKNNSAITPFAQSEMVYTFMEGVDPKYHNVIDTGIKRICTTYPKVLLDNINCLKKEKKKDLENCFKRIGKEVFNKYKEELSNYRMINHIRPILNVVRALPKDELASMAETLINLTSFKMRVSMEEETVGGPIDVAVISKGDGFVWIKRKHYFERELNQHFFANYYNNYYKEVDTDGTESAEKAD